MNSLPVFLLDVDGVLADFCSPALKHARALGAPKSLQPATLDRYDMESYVHHSKRRQWWSKVTARSFCAKLRPYPGAIAVVSQLQTLGDVVAVTAPMDSAHWAHERMAWLRDHFGFTRENVISTSGKYHVGGDFLADDSIDHICKWAFRWGKPNRAFLIERPYNRATVLGYPSGTLDDFLGYVKTWLGTELQYAQGEDGMVAR